MPLIVHLVVGEFNAVEADDLTHPRLSCARRVRVHVEPGSNAGVVRVSGHHPLRAVVHVPAGGGVVVTWKSIIQELDSDFPSFRTHTCSVLSPLA